LSYQPAPLGHLQVTRELIEKDQDRVVAERRNPFVDARRPSAVAPEWRHHLACAELLADIPPQEVLWILMTVENNHFRSTELGSGSYPRDYLAPQLRVLGEQSERYEAVGLTAAHRLGEIEGAVIASPGEPFEPAFDEPLQAIGEVVTAEKLVTVDSVAWEVLDLRYLLDEAVAGNRCAWRAKLANRLNRHNGPTRCVFPVEPGGGRGYTRFAQRKRDRLVTFTLGAT
jgi:hypothetical protein